MCSPSPHSSGHGRLPSDIGKPCGARDTPWGYFAIAPPSTLKELRIYHISLGFGRTVWGWEWPVGGWCKWVKTPPPYAGLDTTEARRF